jgi:hypothetical protein
LILSVSRLPTMPRECAECSQKFWRRG